MRALPTKFQLITELYDQTVQSVTGSYQSWTGFLRAACYNYKCPFDDQILIYAQRPTPRRSLRWSAGIVSLAAGSTVEPRALPYLVMMVKTA